MNSLNRLFKVVGMNMLLEIFYRNTLSGQHLTVQLVYHFCFRIVDEDIVDHHLQGIVHHVMSSLHGFYLTTHLPTDAIVLHQLVDEYRKDDRQQNL